MNTNHTLENLFDLISSLDQTLHSAIAEIEHELVLLKDLINQLEHQLRNLRNEG